jgi:hypothetical protein
MRPVLFILLSVLAGEAGAQGLPSAAASSPRYRLEGVTLGPTAGVVARAAGRVLQAGAAPAQVGAPLVAVRGAPTPGVAAAPTVLLAAPVAAAALPRWPAPWAHAAPGPAAPPGVDPAPPPVRPG